MGSGGVLPSLVSSLLFELHEADSRPDLENNVDTIYGGGWLPAEQAAARLSELLGRADNLQLLSDRLADPEDRALLVSVLAFRVLGPRKVRLPVTPDEVRRLTERAGRMVIAERTADLRFRDWRADDFDLSAVGFDLRLRAHIANVVWTFLLEQYRCRGSFEVAAPAGGVVIDGGACWGDTALYFADRVGAAGRVIAFEFEPGNIRLLEHNLAINPSHGGRISLERSALWHEPEEELRSNVKGPASRIVVDEPVGEGDEVTFARTDTIDALVERQGLDRVSFIKLDVEGAELNALKGGERTLRQFRPRLAIAAYHRIGDLGELAAYLNALDLDYRFRLRHPSADEEETVLFARSTQEADG